jgi:IclR family pca regulon transcriptional regulator
VSSASAPENEFVQSLARGLAVIEAFGRGRQALTLSDVARRANVSRAAARRLLHTLVTLGYAAFDGKHFELRPRVLGLGFAYMSSMGVWDVAQPFLEDLVRETRESCSVAVLDGTEIVHVIRLPAAKRLMSIAVKVGDRLPAHASAMGRVQLAALSPEELDHYFEVAEIAAVTEKTVTDARKLRAILAEVKRQGYSEVDGELEIGLRALAVPVADRAGRVVASIALSTLGTNKAPKGRGNPLLAPLQACAARIHEALLRMPALGH